ncbi:MAG: SUF system NifU family Fe-S cluster assembly protein [Opitutaceae bacterium]
MSELSDLYQEIILDHNRRPRNYGKLDHPTHQAQGHNPLCGDEISVFIKLADGRITDITFDGQGCAISKASASLMTSRLKGKTLEEVRSVASDVRQLLTGPEGEAVDLEKLGDLAALEGVRKYAVRVKCATLAWHALEAALEGSQETTTE